MTTTMVKVNMLTNNYLGKRITHYKFHTPRSIANAVSASEIHCGTNRMVGTGCPAFAGQNNGILFDSPPSTNLYLSDTGTDGLTLLIGSNFTLVTTFKVFTLQDYNLQ